jgi:hypothetical protein
MLRYVRKWREITWGQQQSAPPISSQALSMFFRTSIFLPFRVKRSIGIDSFIGVRAEIIALGLD